MQFNLSIGQNIDQSTGQSYGLDMAMEETVQGAQNIPLRGADLMAGRYDDYHLMEPLAVMDYQLDLFDSRTKN